MSFSARMRRVHAAPCFLTARRIAWFPSSKQAYDESSKAADQVRGLEFAAAFNMPDANY